MELGNNTILFTEAIKIKCALFNVRYVWYIGVNYNYRYRYRYRNIQYVVV